MSVSAPAKPKTFVAGGSWFAECDGMVYPLTECCQASGKGSGNSSTGVCCRACYGEVESAYGAAWLLSEPESMPAELLAELVRLHVYNVTVA